jgi:hypothetical protein
MVDTHEGYMGCNLGHSGYGVYIPGYSVNNLGNPTGGTALFLVNKAAPSRGIQTQASHKRCPVLRPTLA